MGRRGGKDAGRVRAQNGGGQGQAVFGHAPKAQLLLASRQKKKKSEKKLSQRGVGKHVPADRARQDAAEGAALLEMAAEAARAVARRRAMMVGRGEAICWGWPLVGSENRISCAGLI